MSFWGKRVGERADVQNWSLVLYSYVVRPCPRVRMLREDSDSRENLAGYRPAFSQQMHFLRSAHYPLPDVGAERRYLLSRGAPRQNAAGRVLPASKGMGQIVFGLRVGKIAFSHRRRRHKKRLCGRSHRQRVSRSVPSGSAPKPTSPATPHIRRPQNPED